MGPNFRSGAILYWTGVPAYRGCVDGLRWCVAT